MKRLSMIAMLIKLALVFAFVSCSEPFQEESTLEMTTISFSMSGDITSVDMPMSKSGSSDDVYAIQAYYYPKNSTQRVPYAYGVFNDVSNLSLDVFCDTDYEFNTYCIKKGMDDDFCFTLWEKNTGMPFYNANITNTFSYSASKWIGEDTEPTRDAYFGEEKRKITKASTISLNLLRCVFGVKIEVKNLTEGFLTFEILTDPNKPYAFDATPQVSIIEAPYLHFTGWSSPIMSCYFRHQEGKESEILKVKATYTDNTGKQSIVAEDNVEFTRNKKKLITVVLKEEAPSEVANSFSFNIDSQDMENDATTVLIEE